MHDSNTKELSDYRLEQAKIRLLAARKMYDEELFLDSVNRSYYSIFNAIRALCALDGVDFKKHTGLIIYFQQNYIKNNVFDIVLSDYVRDAFSIRQDSDYRDFFVLSKEDAKEQLEHAETLIEKIESYLNRK